MGLSTQNEVPRQESTVLKDQSWTHILILGSISNSVFRKFCISLNNYNIIVQERPRSLEKDHYVKTMAKSSEGRNINA